MKKAKLAIPFKLVNIEEKQFSVFEETLPMESAIEQKSDVGFGVDVTKQVIATSIVYQLQKNDQPLLKIEVVCYFEIEREAFNKVLLKDDHLLLPHHFAKHLAVIVTGTTRGVLFANTKNTPFNEFFMGMINVDAAFQTDIKIKI